MALASTRVSNTNLVLYEGEVAYVKVFGHEHLALLLPESQEVVEVSLVDPNIDWNPDLTKLPNDVVESLTPLILQNGYGTGEN